MNTLLLVYEILRTLKGICSFNEFTFDLKQHEFEDGMPKAMERSIERRWNAKGDGMIDRTKMECQRRGGQLNMYFKLCIIYSTLYHCLLGSTFWLKHRT